MFGGRLSGLRRHQRHGTFGRLEDFQPTVVADHAVSDDGGCFRPDRAP